MGKHIEKAKNENIIRFNPNGEFYFTKGVKAFQRHEMALAKKYLGRALQLEPDEPIIACQLAITLAEMEEYLESNRLLLMVMEELDSYMYECHYFLANNYAYMGLYKDAAHHAKLYLKHEPSGEYVHDARELLEVIFLEDDDFLDESLGNPIFQENDLIEKQEFVRIMLAEGKFREAIDYLDEMIVEYPDFWPAFNNLALAHYYSGNKAEAKNLVEKVLDENPGNLHAMCNLTVFYYYENQNIQDFVAALKKIQPISFDHRYKLGVTFGIIGEHEDGFKWLKSISGANSTEDASFYYWLAYTAYFTGKEQFAKKVWKKLLLLEPEKSGSEPWNASNEE